MVNVVARMKETAAVTINTVIETRMQRQGHRDKDVTDSEMKGNLIAFSVSTTGLFIQRK